ncbi:DUF2878 domain-containing protein [Microbulbifer celer]|uniref:DUF2878 domain-containing protein n=1 Tax=Microbulbifer celer TaxID=435905 RepID=A0ABW3U6J5_9GAMM|nr:DUF2878 domain-containing protein [Microbulbifer celer]
MLWAACHRLTEVGRAPLPSLIIAGLLFEVMWFVCVFAPGTLLVLVVTAGNLAVHYRLFCISSPLITSPRGLRSTLSWVVMISAIGIGMDTALFQAGLLIPANPETLGFGIPLWLACLWVNFALALRFAFVFLRKHLLLAAVFGAIGGPVSYLAGSKIAGEVVLQSPIWLSLSVLGVLWAIFLAGAMKLARLKLFATGSQIGAH